MTDAAQDVGVQGSVGEGRGVAELKWRQAVDVLRLKAVQPLENASRQMALRTVEDLVGFYVLWHLEGGAPGLERLGMPRSTIYRKVKAFRESFGSHPDTFDFPGVETDPEAYLARFGVPEGTAVGMPYVLVEGRDGPAPIARRRDTPS